MNLLTDKEVKQREKDGEATSLAQYFFAVFAFGDKAEEKIASRQFDKVLSKKFRKIVNES